MAVVTQSFALGNHVFDFTVSVENDKTQEKVPYQLTFDRDKNVDQTTVTLVKLFYKEDEYYCPDIRKTVCESFVEFFKMFPDEKVCFQMELTHEQNSLKFLKFWRWASNYRNAYKFAFEIVDHQKGDENLLYAYVTITKI